MTEAKKLEKVIIDNLFNICLNSDREDWDYRNSFREEYKLTKQNITIIFRKYKGNNGFPPAREKKGKHIILCLHRTEQDAQSSDANNTYNSTHII